MRRKVSFIVSLVIFCCITCAQITDLPEDYYYYTSDTIIELPREIIVMREPSFPKNFEDSLVEVTIPRYEISISVKDSKRKEKTQLACIDWVLDTPIKKNTKRKEVVDFINQSKLVRVISNEKIEDYLRHNNKKHEAIIEAYRLGLIKHIIEKTYEPDEQKIQLTGMLALARFYQVNTKIKKIETTIIKDYLESGETLILEKWIGQYY